MQQFPFITLPVVLPGDPDCGQESKVVDGDFLPSQVIAVHDGYLFGCIVYLVSGVALMLNISKEQYRAKVVEYWKAIDKKIEEAEKKRQVSVFRAMPGETQQ